MGLVAIRAGLKAAYLTVPGIGPVLMYPPKSIPGNKTLYTARTGFETTRAGQVRAYRWQFTSRLAVLWQDAEQGEIDLDSLTQAIVDAIDANPHLGGALNSGLAEITAGDDGWFSIPGGQTPIWYRFCDFDVSVLEKKVT